MRLVPTLLAPCAWFGLALLAVPSATVFSQTFTPIQANLPIGGPAAWADFDNDGDLDFAVQNASTRLLRNNGNQSFTNILTLAFGGGALAWGDYDNDGQVDLLATGRDSSGRFISRLLRNEGQGAFSTNQVSGIPPFSYGAAAWGDYNNDGRLDLLLAGQSTNDVGPFVAGVYRNNGDGTFSDIHAGLVAVGDGAVAWGDFNNDRYLDILLCGRINLGGAAATRVYQNNHDGTFADIGAGLPGIWLGQAVWGDLNNDGFLDIVLSGRLSNAAETSRIYRNRGDGTFSYLASALSTLGAASIGLGDFNNDGYLDVVLAEKTASLPLTRLYLNNQGGSFTDAGAGLPGIFAGTVTCLDADNDGKLDVLLSWDGFSRIYRNTIPSTNAQPPIPGGLMTTLLPHNHVLLNWTSPLGPESGNSSGLSYNLRVGSSPGGIDVCSPQSDLSSGMRRIPDRGNAGSTQAWHLANLPKGTYYWSVQSIDHGFHASPFAPESSFVITNDLDAASNHAPVAEPLDAGRSAAAGQIERD